MGDPNPLGAFLRSRRDLLTPAEAGLTPGDHRRVPGLRRAEVASLAGLSTDYYMRLEQGRERHPSDQVITALARVMGLEPEAAAYLRRLTRPLDATPITAERADEATGRLLEALCDVPACVAGAALDVLAVNPAGKAFYGGFDRVGNLVEMVFLDPSARTFFRDWDDIATGTVRSLRASYAAFPGNDRIRSLAAMLADASEEFASRWAQHRLVERTSERKRYCHPVVGDLELQFSAYAVSSCPGQHLYVYLPEPGSPSAERIQRLRR